MILAPDQGESQKGVVLTPVYARPNIRPIRMMGPLSMSGLEASRFLFPWNEEDIDGFRQARRLFYPVLFCDLLLGYCDLFGI